jgi:acid-sensing ion channel, other
MNLIQMEKKLMKRLKIGRALSKSFREFLGKTYVHAYHYLVEPNRHIIEKIMWIIIHITMTVSAIYIVLFAWSRFTDNPTITTLESQHYSIYNLDFPAVAICNNNKISRKAAEEYGDFL